MQEGITGASCIDLVNPDAGGKFVQSQQTHAPVLQVMTVFKWSPGHSPCTYV